MPRGLLGVYRSAVAVMAHQMLTPRKKVESNLFAFDIGPS